MHANSAERIAALEHELATLQAAYQRLQLTVDRVADGVTVQAATGAVVYLNDAAARICGFPDAATFLQTPLAEVWRRFELLDDAGQPFPPERLPGRLALAGEPNPPETTVCFRIVATGEQRWSTIRATPIVEPDGQISGVVNSWHDVTALKQRELELAAEREYFAVTLASIGDAVIVTDPTGRINFLNSCAEELTGWVQADAVGQPIERIFHIINEESRQPVENPVTKVLRVGGVVGLANHTLLITRDGCEIPIHDSGAPIKDAQGQLQGVVLVFRDMIEQREAERRITEQAEILEIINRTGALLAGELDLQTLVQAVTDATTSLVGAEFGSFFYNVINKQGEAYTLYTISGVPREAFASFPMPRNTKVFSPTFKGEGVVRSDDITQDPRYGQSPPHHGMPPGHLPVRSYLAVPVISRSGEVIGGLFFGHSQPGVFTSRAEQLVAGLVAQTAIAVDNARLFAALQREQQRLAASEHTYRTLAEAIPQIVFTSDADGAINYVNERWSTYTGLTLAETQVAGWAQALHPDDLQPTLERWRHAVLTGTLYEVVCRYRRSADGMYRWHIARAYPLQDQHGRISRWFGTSTDIHDQKQLAEGMRFLADASAELSASMQVEQMFPQLAQLVVPRFGDWCGIYLVDGGGQLQPHLRYHHDPARLALVQRLFDDYPPDPQSGSALYQVLQSGQPIRVASIDEAQLVASAHDPEHLALLRALALSSLLVVPIQTPTKIVGVLSMAWSDPTRQYMEEDAAIAVELGRRAGFALENAQLYQETQQALRTRDQFFSIAAHELKTPMTSILGYTQLLERRAEREGGTPQERRTVRAIVDQVRRMHRLSLALLDLSRLQEGTLSLEWQTVDVAQLLQRIVDDLQPTLDRHVVTLAIVEPVPLLDADELRLEQVFQNLIQNAIKYSPVGGPIHVALQQANGEAEISIRDQGIGIPAPSLSRLFQRYYRAENVAAQHLAGMGLGLYIVKEIVVLHGGRVTVESEEGQGSTFRVYLPVHADAQGTPTTPPGAITEQP